MPVGVEAASPASPPSPASAASRASAVDVAALRDRVAAPAPAPGRVPGAWRHAVGERLPVWVRLRCGIEPRTLAALALVLVAAGLFAGYRFWAGRPQTVRAPVRDAPVAAAVPSPATPSALSPALSAAAGAPAPEARTAARGVVVDVAGKVRHPGVRHLPPGSRVADALEAAGGARPGVDTSGLNRARLLMDGEQILVGGGATAAGVPGAGGAAGAAGAGPGSPGGPGGPAGPGGVSGPVSLNSATLEQLDALPGVGPVLAQHILDYRAQHGGFRSVADLRHVNGIGSRRFTDLKPLVQP
ncbi:hypothetical protein BLA24_21055 [Streptomyces cinnamoneus]|uniref:Soluble ligand binding domain-containing protein n=2 Tax=Streptomyces cinnamoneus TaxID=53446 RepID=A0A2G1XFR4_STRCJ|nr:ComEA family DNA-binding protein [Streptomyces cinnamoneus]PHQ50086.1 hypothetical protein BLA24_21055 [Streptomyces cinnamoneus]PPT16458.1 DNA-binding protein [Streptomyces cinnamoneus]